MTSTDRCPHTTVPVQVWIDADEKIAAPLRWLNSLSGVRTFSSCEGTIVEGGPAPYGAYIKAWWPPEHDVEIKQRFKIIAEGNGWSDLEPLHPWHDAGKPKVEMTARDEVAMPPETFGKLLSENARLKAERDAANERANRWSILAQEYGCDECSSTLDELKAQVESLKQALERLLPYFRGEHSPDHPDVLFAEKALASPAAPATEKPS
jgi:hypothetical protein